MVLFSGCVALVTLFAYLPALGNSFVNWDDDVYVYNNTFIKSFNTEFVRWAFSQFYASNWHPLTWMSHALDYAIWGLNPFGHHLPSVVIHVCNTFLVVLLSFRLLQGRAYSTGAQTAAVPSHGFQARLLFSAALTGLLFGIHPLHVESVAWVAERKDVLCAFFFLLSILFYLRYIESRLSPAPVGVRAYGHYLFSFLFFFLAILSKPMAVTLPVILLIIDWFPLERLSREPLRRILLEKTPFVVISLASSVITIMAQRSENSIASLRAIPWTDRIAVSLQSTFLYLVKIFFPFGLRPLYSYSPSVDPWSYEYLLPALIVFVATIGCGILAKMKREAFLAAWGSYIVMLVPVIGILQVGSQSMADRYTYLPTIGIFMLMSSGLSSLLGRMEGAWKTAARGVAGIALLAAILSLISLTKNQIGIWKDSGTLWIPVVEAEPQNADAWNHLAVHYLDLKSYDRAEGYARTALAAMPRNPCAHNTLGEILIARGDYQEACNYFLKALAIDPSSPVRFYNVAYCLEKTGKARDACGYWNQFLQRSPSPADRQEVSMHMEELHCP